jgi:hypothetical protein
MQLRVAGLALCVAGLVLSGCGTGGDQREVRSATERFYAAVQHRDGRAACALLDSDTASQLVKDQQEPDCARAVLKLQLHGSQAASTSVYGTSAQVRLAGGDTVFLGWTHNGWRIDAVGCRVVAGGGPLECEEES